ncbi:MAG: hypothetical protein IH987_04310 [Planctomycetes bacterium]|nr:hypothetical protein [Planctomycetota bacterium]
MNVRRGRSRLFTFMCIAFVVLGATSLAGCTLEQAATNPIVIESAGKAFSSFFDFAQFTVDPDRDEAEDFDLDFPAE